MATLTWTATKFWHERPLRTCRTKQRCSLCGLAVTPGQRYFDGGKRRAHESCVDVGAEKAAKHREQSGIGGFIRVLREQAS